MTEHSEPIRQGEYENMTRLLEGQTCAAVARELHGCDVMAGQWGAVWRTPHLAVSVRPDES